MKRESRLWTLIAPLLFVFATSVPAFGGTATVSAERMTPAVKAVNLVSPAVVNITTEARVEISPSPFDSFGGSSLFDEFFRDFFAPHYQEERPASIGSGVVIRSNGTVLTNHHVTAGASRITVKLNDGRKLPAELLGAAPDADLALLKIKGSGPFPAAKLGTSKDLMIAETVIAIGNPYGLSHTVTTGVISALHRRVQEQDRTYENFIQTDAAINPGNSGGPLINILGEVIGINTAILSRSGGSHGIGFAIPVDTARRIVDDLFSFGEVQPVWAGAFVQDLRKGLDSYFNPAAGEAGVLVREVEIGGPAAEAGLKRGDLLLKIDEIPLDGADNFRSILSKYTANDLLPLTVRRDSQTVNLSLRLRYFPAGYGAAFAKKRLGFTLRQVGTSFLRQGRNPEAYLAVDTVTRQSPAGKLGLARGDLLLQVGQMKVTTKEEFEKAMLHNIYRKDLLLLVQRGSYGYYVTLSYGS